MRIAKSKVHFIGIGGAGMSGLAELIHNMGAEVTGSDLSENSQVERLRQMGVKVFKGHSDKNIIDPDVVVYSSAVPFTNPEIVEARRRKIPIIPRIEVLVEVMRLKRGIAVGGTHGKTTTTSMIASIFLSANTDPTVVVGGRLDLIKSHAFLGKGEWLIAESDESDGSFLKLSPEIAVITNIDNDHLDHYGNFENLRKAFLEFARKVPFYGLVVAWGDSSDVRNTLENFNKRVVYYGFDAKNDYHLKKEDDGYLVFKGSERLGLMKVGVPGRHNALNALASVIVGLEAGIPISECLRGIEKFSGVDRRFQFKGEAKGVKFYDDYGHHPTEVKAVIQAFREKFPNEKFIIAFQPHRFSRTQICWGDFLESFEGATTLLVWDIYAASEAPIEGITSERLAKEICHRDVVYVGHGEGAIAKTLERLRTPGVFLTLGAGDISKMGMEIFKRM